MVPIFGRKERPTLEGLTKDETKVRDALNDEVLRRAGEKGVAGQAPAAVSLMREKVETEPHAFLWPYQLGLLMMSMSRFDQAADAFQEATKRSPDDVRGFYGLANAFFQAAESRRVQEGSASLSGSMAEMTIDNLYHEALRNFRRAYEMTDDKEQRATLSSATSVVEKAIAKKAGRL